MVFGNSQAWCKPLLWNFDGLKMQAKHPTVLWLKYAAENPEKIWAPEVQIYLITRYSLSCSQAKCSSDVCGICFGTNTCIYIHIYICVFMHLSLYMLFYICIFDFCIYLYIHMCLIYTINYLHIHVYSCMHVCSYLNMFLHV